MRSQYIAILYLAAFLLAAFSSFTYAQAPYAYDNSSVYLKGDTNDLH